MLFLMIAGLVLCCSKSTVSHGGSVMDYVSLIDSLRAAGASVEPAGEISQPFFSVKGRTITVNGGGVQVFEYGDASAAASEAKLVSPDGEVVDKSRVGWVAPPHFFKKGKLIVLYVGDNVTITKALETVLGAQFAGK
jgi:hypothetical protein